MRVFFLNPPFKQGYSRVQRSPGVIRSGTMYYPYWLAHAAALARSRGHKIFLSDASAENRSLDDVARQVRDFGAEMIVAATSTPSARNDFHVLSQLKAAFPQVHTMAVGTHASATWEEALTQFGGVDSIAIGEYDYTVCETAEALETPGRGLDGVLSLAYRDAGGQVVRTPERPLIHNLDELPWVAPIYREFLNIRNYWFSLAEHPMVMLISGRGCKARCFYCVYPQVMHGHQYRVRSPKHIAGEMRWIQDHMPEVKNIVFEDDTFSGDQRHCVELAEEIRRQGVRLPWFANLRTEADYELMKTLRAAGLREVAVGFESGDDLILRNMRKGQTVAKQLRFREDARKAGLLVHGCFMVGFPGETRATMEQTLQLAMRLNPDSAQFYPMMPYPGTGAFEWAQANGYLATEDYERFLRGDGTHRCYLNLPGLSPGEIEAFCERAVRRFHLRPTFILRKLIQALTNRREGARLVKAGGHFLRSLFRDRTRVEGPLAAAALPMPEGWREPVRVPRGRMERLSLPVAHPHRAEHPQSPNAGNEVGDPEDGDPRHAVVHHYSLS